MAKVLDVIDERLREWIARQPMFFVATAPRADDGHVNVSPKGPGGTLRVLGPDKVAYADVYGSGAETIAHLRENGRIVVMFCAFEGPPRIVRLHGSGSVVFPGEPAYAELDAQAGFEPWTIEEGRRAIIVVDVTRVAESCGYGVPLMTFAGERPHMPLAKEKRLRTLGPDGMAAHQLGQNTHSIDGLPAVSTRVAVHSEPA